VNNEIQHKRERLVHVAAVNVARVFFGETDGLDSGFTSSYTGDSEPVPARRSAGERSDAS
jgi:hypothetical protein